MTGHLGRSERIAVSLLRLLDPFAIRRFLSTTELWEARCGLPGKQSEHAAEALSLTGKVR
jgi:hypothetical protein